MADTCKTCVHCLPSYKCGFCRLIDKKVKYSHSCGKYQERKETK